MKSMAQLVDSQICLSGYTAGRSEPSSYPTLDTKTIPSILMFYQIFMVPLFGKPQDLQVLTHVESPKSPAHSHLTSVTGILGMWDPPP